MPADTFVKPRFSVRLHERGRIARRIFPLFRKIFYGDFEHYAPFPLFFRRATGTNGKHTHFAIGHQNRRLFSRFRVNAQNVFFKRRKRAFSDKKALFSVAAFAKIKIQTVRPLRKFPE